MKIKINKNQLYRQLMWDYNLPVDKIDDLIDGKIDRLGHYNRETIFKKMLETFPWFILIELIDIEVIKELLNHDIIKTLKSPALRENYFYVSKRLQEIIPNTR